MLTKEENQLLTQVGPGTPAGDLLRRYWHPITATSQLASHGTRAITVLGESLVLYRDRQGRLGLVADRCPHRQAGMLYGAPEQEGLRCAYHGWLFNASGRCLEQPFEQAADPGSTFKDRVTIKAYPVEELGGMIFAYLGPEPVPLLPRWDLFTRDDLPREIGTSVVPCNWLQITENALDPVHLEWLHQHFHNYVMERLGRTESSRLPGRHVKIGFSVFDHGIIKRRLLEGDTEAHERWATGHPLVFPMMLKSGSVSHPVFQMRTPIDEKSTLYFWYGCHLRRRDDDMYVPRPEEIPFYEVPLPGVDERGDPIWSLVDNNSGQDMAMWYTQGEITDRTAEHLGQSDQGIILYRKLLKDSIEKVRRGEDPMNVLRDPAKNVCLELPVEEDKVSRGPLRAGGPRLGNATKYSPLLKEAEQAAAVPVPVGTKRR